MGRWAILLGGLLAWAAHLFLLYAIASIFPGQAIATWLALAATIVALAANSIVLLAAASLVRTAEPRSLDRWIGEVGKVGAALSAVAVLWQLLPAFI